MDSVNGVSANYGDYVQRAVKRNTLEQAADARQNGRPLDTGQLQSSNQQIRNDARETGVELYSQQMLKQSYQTYANTSTNGASGSNDGDADDNNRGVYSLNAENVNNTLQTARSRALGVAAYSRFSDGDSDDGNRPSRPSNPGGPAITPVDKYV